MKRLFKYYVLCIICLAQVVSARQVTIIFSGSANGVLESCNCPGNPFGGLVNRAAVVDSLCKIYPEALVVDVGDFLPVRPDSLKSMFVVKAMQACSIDAVCPGDQDFALGIEFVRRMKLPMVSASLTDTAKQQLLFPAFRQFERNGTLRQVLTPDATVNIWFTGLFEPSFLQWVPDFVRQQISALSLETAWKKLEDDQREHADMVIVLSHQGYDRDVAFLETAPGVDLLISGHSQMLIREPKKIGNSWIAAPGKNGEHIGIVRFEIDDKRPIEMIEYKLIPLIAEQVGESVEIAAMVKEYNRLYKEQLRTVAIAAGRKFHGTQTCALCHTAQFKHWQTTPHSHALETLRLISKDSEITCLDCHTTGLGYPGGFVNIEQTPDQAGVGCEECHRIPPGTKFGLELKHKVLPVSSNWCTRCHVKPHIIEFDYEKMRKKVVHSTGEGGQE